MNTCPVCLAGDFERWPLRTGDRSYRRCPDCGFIQMDASCRLDEADERARYELHENSPQDSGYVAWLNRFLDFALPPQGRLRVLDFGSGPEPVMASLMREKGHEVHIEDKYFTEEQAEGPFDLITSVEVFEHLADPRQTLADLRGRLTSRGTVCISTEMLPEDPDDFTGWHYRSDPTHISFFTVKALESLALNASMTLSGCDGRRYASFGLNARLIR